MELISRSDTWRKFISEIEDIADLEDIDRILNSMPTIEEQKEGEWIPVDSYSAFGGDEATWEVHGNPTAYHYCSECKEDANVNEFGEELLTNFCPNCGARMKGEK